MPEVIVWGRRPPPLGGVTRCVQSLSAVLTRESVDHIVIDWRERSALRAALTERRAVHVHNVSSVFRLLFVTAARLLNGAHTIVFFHSGTLAVQVRSPLRWVIARIGFSLAHETWATNADLAHLIDSLGGSSTQVVSPFSSAGAHNRRPALARVERATSPAVVFFVGYGMELYGLDLVLDLMRDERLSALSWTLITYGDDQSTLATSERARQAGAQVLINLDPDDIHTELLRHDVLLRPTTTDGDAMVVREALDLGLRVVASDVVPRPAGVELCSLDREDVVLTLLHGGVLSDGTGLGVSVADQVIQTVRAGRGR